MYSQIQNDVEGHEGKNMNMKQVYKVATLHPTSSMHPLTHCEFSDALMH